MADLMQVSDVRFTPAPVEDRSSGLIGFVSFVLDNAIQVDGVTVRRSKNGAWSLSFPKRTDENGARRSYVRPITDEVRTAITAQVFATLQQWARRR